MADGPWNSRGRRYRRPAPWHWVAGVVAFLILLVLRLYQDRGPEQPELLEPGRYRVARAVDGDTLLLANHARIRLLGVDTPETKRPDWPVEPWGPEASAFTEEFIHGGEVELSFDRERQDDYGRFLAYVWVDGRLLNEELLRAGLGRPLLRFPYSSAMKGRFRRAADEARREHRGIWSESKPRPPALPGPREASRTRGITWPG